MLALAISDAGVLVEVVVQHRITDARLVADDTPDMAAVVAFECNCGDTVIPLDSHNSPHYSTLWCSDGAASVYTAEMEKQELTYFKCRPTHPRVAQTIYHYLNILPFGLHRPYNVFAVKGRHTNKGIVAGVAEDGRFKVLTYPLHGGQPLQLRAMKRVVPPTILDDDEAAFPVLMDPTFLTKIRRDSLLPEVRRDLQTFFSNSTSPVAPTPASVERDAASGRTATPLQHLKSPLSMSEAPLSTPSRKSSGLPPRRGSSAEKDTYAFSPAAAAASHTLELYELQELQLAPPLALHDPMPPLRVGTRVIARRFGCRWSLYLATVVAVAFDVSYTLRYDVDGAVDVGVLHMDLHALSLDDDRAGQAGRLPPLEVNKEVCTVRDHVCVAFQHQQPAVVLEACGKGIFRVSLEQNPAMAWEVSSRQIVSVAPVLRDATYANPAHLRLFRRLDATGSGRVAWKDLRHVILSWESFGQPLSFQRLGEIQRDMCIRKRRVEPHLLRRIPIQQEELQLSFQDVEYVLLRASNLM